MEINKDLTQRRFNIKDLAGSLWHLLVARKVKGWQDWRCARAKAYLLTHDQSYRSSYVGMQMVRRRQILYDQDVSPTDDRIPDRWSIEKVLPPMSWPNKDKFN